MWKSASKLVGLLMFWRRPSAAPEKPMAIPKVAPERDIGEFYFRDTILDQLPRYFKILKRMKKGDREAYNYFSRAGAWIMPENYSRDMVGGDRDPLFNAAELSPWWKTNRPTRGMVVFGAWKSIGEEDEIGHPFINLHAVSFVKYAAGKQPPDIQQVRHGDVYKVTMYWDDLAKWVGRKHRHGVPQDFAVVVFPNGNVEPLNTMFTEYTKIRAKRSSGSVKKGETFRVPYTRFGIWPEYVRQKGTVEAARKWLVEVFIMAANQYECTSNGFTRISVTKNNITASFAVDILRTPYFFKDRDATTLVNGRRKKIFHIVRSHHRHLNNGRVIPVRTHFRGDRSFTWNSYKVSVSVPGWHFATENAIDIGAHDVDEEQDLRKYLDETEWGGTVRGWQDSGLGAHPRATSVGEKR